jgi:hypothetical protein
VNVALQSAVRCPAKPKGQFFTGTPLTLSLFMLAVLLHNFAQQIVYVYNTSLFRSRPLGKVQRDRPLEKGRPKAERCRVNRLKSLATARYRNSW